MFLGHCIFKDWECGISSKETVTSRGTVHQVQIGFNLESVVYFYLYSFEEISEILSTKLSLEQRGQKPGTCMKLSGGNCEIVLFSCVFVLFCFNIRDKIVSLSDTSIESERLSFIYGQSLSQKTE